MDGSECLRNCEEYGVSMLLSNRLKLICRRRIVPIRNEWLSSIACFDDGSVYSRLWYGWLRRRAWLQPVRCKGRRLDRRRATPPSSCLAAAGP